MLIGPGHTVGGNQQIACGSVKISHMRLRGGVKLGDGSLVPEASAENRKTEEGEPRGPMRGDIEQEKSIRIS